MPPKDTQRRLLRKGHASFKDCSHKNWRTRALSVWNNILEGFDGDEDLKPVRTAVFRHGSRRAAIRILTAIILNHIRRILAPSLAQFFWHHALADMKLARSAPHHYLEEAAEFEWMGFALWFIFTRGIVKLQDLLREGAVRDRLGDGWAVLYLTGMLTGLERGYVRTCWTFAQLYAYGRLFTGGEAENAFLERFLAEKSTSVMVQLGVVMEWIVYGIVPVVLSGQWSLTVLHAVVWGGTAYVARHAGKFFLLLEMSDVFVTFGWMGCGMVFIGMEALRASIEGAPIEKSGDADGTDGFEDL